jgi:large subunit ribosomal protein L36
MKISSSLKNLRKRKGCKLVRRFGCMYVINEENPKFKAKQGFTKRKKR